MQNTCELQKPDDPFVWATVSLSASGIPLCGYFLWESYKTWTRLRRTVRVCGKASNQSLDSCSHSTLNADNGSRSPAEATCPQKTVPVAASKSALTFKASVLPHSQNERHPCSTGSPLLRTAAQVGGQARKCEWANPLPWLRRLTFNETLQLSLLSSWFLMTIDQFLDTSYVSSVMFFCPNINCKRQALVDTPGCPAAVFTYIQLYIQPLAACLFVLATMNRFVRVYAVLSRTRQLVLQIGSGVIVVATALRWMAIPLLQHLIYLPTGAYDEVVPDQTALLLYNVSFHGAYLVLSLADIMSLLLGLHYVMEIRSEVNRIKKRHNMGGPGLQSTVSQLIQASNSFVANPGPGPLVPPPSPAKPSKLVQRQEESAATALFWILFNVVLLAAYLSVMLVPDILASLPIQFVFALLTMILKLFVTGMTLSINAMTRLVRAQNRAQAQGPS